jgi:hypothetical protein
MAYLPLRWVGNGNGTPEHIETYAEGTSETFLSGDLVIYDQSENGVVALTATSGVPDTVAFLGIARTAASGTPGTAIDVLIPNAGDIFSAILCSAVDTTVAPDHDNIGQLYSLVKNGSTLDSVYGVLEGGTDDWVKVINLDRQDQARQAIDPWAATQTGTAGDRVYFQFLTAALDGSGTQA